MNQQQKQKQTQRFQKYITRQSMKADSQRSQILNKILCQCRDLGHFVCVQSNCRQYAFFCSKCQFQIKQKSHSNCFAVSLQKMLKKIQEKIIDVSDLIDYHDKIIDEIIDNLIDNLSKIKFQFRQKAETTYKYLEMSDNQRQIWVALSSSQIKEIQKLIGNDFSSIFSKRYTQKQKKIVQLNEVKSQIILTWNKIQSKLKQQIQKGKTNIIFQQSKFFKKAKHQPDYFLNSKIVQTFQQKKILQSFFEKTVKSTRMLYRASQNMFCTEKFYQKCCKIPNTLTLIINQWNKKIGGFTPLQWKRNYSQKPVKLSDETFSSFIFSVTNNEKFSQFQRNDGIFNQKGYGPIFGGYSADLGIVNNANTSSLSLGKFGNGYVSSKYQKATKQALQLFCGSSKDCKFKIKQWQVWQISFQK